ncbi:MAG TPA: SDR family NAD(P)-dependent oxidoreductase [Lapillicoccus sp.]|jgi:NAD(P)-dependent dehydrogenase (short-subunit alcohol dehydrogenase family)|nr:SDR family NAD(P)-dependent oxidoreductase [Lapillicoccus sp.]
MTSTSRTALVTGASAGLGRALATTLADRGWTLVVDARGADRLAEVAAELSRRTTVDAVPGSVTDPTHRAELATAVRRHGHLDLLVHNASELGGSPQPSLTDLESQTFHAVLETNVVAPAALTRELLPDLTAARGTVLAVSSDAAVEHYEGWGAYGASKAALDHLVGTFASEHPSLRWYAVDPGDMRTAMHQAAFPGEDISDRPLPETVVPALLRLLEAAPSSGRYRAIDFAVAEVVA